MINKNSRFVRSLILQHYCKIQESAIINLIEGGYIMFKWIMKQPDSDRLVPQAKIASTYRWRQFGVLLATCIGYIGYYIIRLVFTTEHNDIMK